jgi:hypothetical protein
MMMVMVMVMMMTTCRPPWHGRQSIMYFDMSIYKMNEIRIVKDKDPIVPGTLIGSYGKSA